jgi:ABC transporter substrate binding protein (PQQ-dependent alcohol dehydrogenase system)
MTGLRLLCTFVAVLLPMSEIALADGLKIHMLYAEQQIERPPTLSGLTPVPADLGLEGAKLAVEENRTTGKFTGDDYVLDTLIAPVGGSLADRLAKAAELPDFIIMNAPAAELLKIADLPALRGRILFNVAARDEALRERDCRANLLHTMPSRAMLADALAQFLLIKKWTRWLLLPGPRENDRAYAEALRRSAVKFGHEIVDEKPWALEGDMRESAATEIPLITQGSDYDIVMVADENNDFGPLIAYNTDLPRPVAGTHGLVATGWSEVIEPWGAIQLQNRFAEQAHRPMREVDFAAWLAVRIVGEAVTRAKSGDVKQLREFILSEDLQLSAFKGRGLTFRRWNGQMRQPIHLVTKETQVAVAPFEAFLHEFTDLDTLGFDRPETQCKVFPEEAE